jgi:Tfp pilus assembly protein PilF
MAIFSLQIALAHQQNGRLGEAETAYRQVLSGDPRNVEALNNLANVLHERGQLDEAAACLERALAIQGDSAYLHFNLANVLRDAGQGERAVAGYRQALALMPDFAACHNNLGTLLLERGDLAGAGRALAEAVRVDPVYAEGHYNLGSLKQDRGDLAGAVASYLRSIELRPDNAVAHYNLGMVHQAQGDWAAARQAFLEALRLRPDYAQPHCHLGIQLLAHGEDEQALAHFERALQIDPECPEAHFNRGVVLLGRGDYEAGWPEYEWNARCPSYARQEFDAPAWDGSPLAGRTILIHCDRGLGDTLQMARWLDEVGRRGAGRILFAAQEVLHPLLADAGLGELVSPSAQGLEFDVYVSVMNLPCVIRASDATIPPADYLRAQEPLVAQWRETLRDVDGFRVGIAWQGDRNYVWDHLRSIPLEQFEPLSRVRGVRLVALQKGDGREQLQNRRGRFEVIDLGADVDRQGAFVDTAAIIANLDLVITSDSAVAHLAGTLGAPVWVALPRGAEWRWQRGRDTSPWYPTMRLFRQVSAEDWAGILNQMAEELQSMTSARRANG